MGEVHAHRRRLAQDREGRIAGRPLQQLGPDAQRLVGRVADAEHPLVAAHAAHAAPHLVGQGLEAQAMVRFGQRTGDGLVGPLRCLRLQEDVDGFLEPAAQQVVVAVKRDEPAVRHAGLLGRWKR